MSNRRALIVYAIVAALVLVAVGFIVLQPVPPEQAAPPRVTSTLPASAGPTSTLPATAGSSSTTRQDNQPTCRAGVPKRLVIPALGVDAPFERIGVDETAPTDASGKHPLGVPVDRKNAGWYADGPEPGSGTGTVLVNGHTYRNGSAIFREDFSTTVEDGQLIHLIQDNGSTCSYRVDRVWRDVNSEFGYPRLVTSQHLYDFSGPERLLLVTCSGSWNSFSQSYDDVSVLLATPVTATR